MSETIGAHRRKQYKKTFERDTGTERHEALSKLRKDDREKAFSLKRHRPIGVSDVVEDAHALESELRACLTSLSSALVSYNKEGGEVGGGEIANDKVGLLAPAVVNCLRRMINFIGAASTDDAHCEKAEELLKANLLDLLRQALSFKEPVLKGVLYEAIWCVGSIAAGSAYDASQVIGLASLLEDALCTSDRDLQLQAGWALGNLAVDHTADVLKLPRALPRTFEIIQMVLDAPGGFCCSDNAGLLRTLIFFLCNIVRVRHDEAYDTILFSLEGGRHLLRLIGADQLVSDRSVTDDKRGAIGEALWCVAYLSSPSLKYAYSFKPSIPIVGLLLSRMIDTGRLAHTPPSTPPYNPSLQIPTPPSPAESQVRAPATPPQGSVGVLSMAQELLDSVFHYDEELMAEITQHSLDLVVPILKILNNLCGWCTYHCSDPAAGAGEELMDQIAAMPGLVSYLHVLLFSTHRGIKADAARLAASLAAGRTRHLELVIPVLPRMCEMLDSPESYNIKREAAAYILNVGFNDGVKHLATVMEQKPSVVDGMMALLEKSKYDKQSVLVALDFIEGVMMFWRGGRRLLFDKNAIEVMESAQFLHDEMIERKIGWMVERYFDDLDVEPDSLDDHVLHDQIKACEPQR
eukprot:GHVQ01032056.1.p1 GENE.GHVQ01032056.1~~GHVQ01032056.1.p1  ORF type:complete len:634 (-),score=110.86 GHVQ01032056.1:967-2868(-)